MRSGVLEALATLMLTGSAFPTAFSMSVSGLGAERLTVACTAAKALSFSVVST
jgi:hypothetical protein